MKGEKLVTTNNAKETQLLGERLAKALDKKRVLALYGDLGSGKTTFTQGLAKGLGIKRRIISPTFIIVRKYRIKNIESRIMNFYHIDLYRIDRQKDIDGLGIEEIINDPKSIVAIEWAEKLENLLPKKRIDIKFEYLNENKRKITIINFD